MSAAPISACPACLAAPAAEALAGRAGAPAGGETRPVVLSLPTIHCAACISTVERTLAATPGVSEARVNLSLKRVQLRAAPQMTAEALIAILAGVGYQALELDAGHLGDPAGEAARRALLMRLAVAGFAMMNVMLLSVAIWSGATTATRELFHWISAAITLPAVVFAAQPFFASGWSALRVGRLNMDVPISLAILLASGMSLFETIQGGEHAYFDAALSLTFFLLAGRYLDMRTRGIARSAAQELAALEVPRALRADGVTVVAAADLVPGDLIRVLPGMRIPADGEVTAGESEIDRSILTGESMPVAVAARGGVNAGEINLTGPLTIRVTAAGGDTALRRMAELVAVAETARNRYTSLADRAARIYAPLVHILALAAFAAWFAMTGDLRLSLNIAVAVLIITCPCALGLAVPAVTTAASGRLFRAGVLIKSPTALERLAEVDSVAFDKTGTLTLGTPLAIGLDRLDPAARSVALALAAQSAHPLARALAAALRAAGCEPAPLDAIAEVPGRGVEARAGDALVRLGRADWVGAEPAEGTASYLRTADGRTHVIDFAETLRPGTPGLVARLDRQGMGVMLLSGDAPRAVGVIARTAGIAAWEAGLSPQDKAARMAVIARAGHRALMVGDGLNDTAALASAHVSMSPASALEVSRVISDFVVLGSSLEPVAEAIDTARRATARIRENFALAALYNLVAVPLALAGVATPLHAALAMSTSSILVTLNAMRLLRK